jgi:hypothetical protein
MAETNQIELQLIQRRASAGNYYVNRHVSWDAARGGGDLYLQPKKKFRGDLNGNILAYATAEQIHAKLTELGA